jgi:hypothetical protein
MSYASKHISLAEIQQSFVRQLDDVSVIADIDLSEEDYRYLATKVKILFKFSNGNNVVDDYKLAIVVYWVFSMIYWDSTSLDVMEMDLLFDGLPQYKKKYFLDICMEAFDDYGIYRYPVEYKDAVWAARAVMARHASVPKEERSATFKVISTYLDCNLVADMVEAIMMELPPKTQAILCCLDDQTKQAVILELRNLMIECMSSTVPREIVMHKYPYVAVHVVDAMMDWCEQHELNAELLS